jgi:hypothetical protein
MRSFKNPFEGPCRERLEASGAHANKFKTEFCKETNDKERGQLAPVVSDGAQNLVIKNAGPGRHRRALMPEDVAEGARCRQACCRMTFMWVRNAERKTKRF